MKSEELALLYQRQSKLAAVMGDRDGQLQALKKALDVDRRSVTIANELADLAESIGDDDLALRALRVVAANPVKDAKILALAYLRQARIAHGPRIARAPSSSSSAPCKKTPTSKKRARCWISFARARCSRAKIRLAFPGQQTGR